MLGIWFGCGTCYHFQRRAPHKLSRIDKSSAPINIDDEESISWNSIRAGKEKVDEVVRLEERRPSFITMESVKCAVRDTTSREDKDGVVHQVSSVMSSQLGDGEDGVSVTGTVLTDRGPEERLRVYDGDGAPAVMGPVMMSHTVQKQWHVRNEQNRAGMSVDDMDNPEWKLVENDRRYCAHDMPEPPSPIPTRPTGPASTPQPAPTHIRGRVNIPLVNDASATARAVKRASPSDRLTVFHTSLSTYRKSGIFDEQGRKISKLRSDGKRTDTVVRRPEDVMRAPARLSDRSLIA